MKDSSTETKKRKPASLIVRECQQCGSCVETRSRKLLFCDGCARARKSMADASYKAKKRPTVKSYTCVKCATVCSYEGRVPKKYCQECKGAAKREAQAKHDKKRRTPMVVGSLANCERCGDEFTKNGSNHLFCVDCSVVERRACIRRWSEENRTSVRASAKKYNDKKRSTPQGHLEWTMRVAVRRAIGGNRMAGRRTFDAIGYTVDELKAHLEKQFANGMSWDNYGDWHIDHIIPLAAHSYQSVECMDFKRAWALTNLRPLWASENMSKGAKILMLL